SHEDLVRGCALPVRERLPAAVAPSPRLRIVRSAPVPTCEGRCPGAEKGFARSLRSRGLASRVADDVEPSTVRPPFGRVDQQLTSYPRKASAAGALESLLMDERFVPVSPRAATGRRCSRRPRGPSSKPRPAP